ETVGPTPTILNVDDNLAGRYAVSKLLRQEGYFVREAETGSEALRLAEDNPDLVVLDLNLPDISGLEVCRRLKADPRTASIPVLHLTATHQDAQTWATALEGGANAFLVEPTDPVVLLATVRALLRAREAEEQLRLSEARLRFLSEASRLLAGADDEQALATLATMAVPALADWAMVDLLDPSRRIRRLVAVHGDPERAPAMRQIQEHPPRWHSPSLIAAALKTGSPQIVTSAPLSWIQSAPDGDARSQAIKDLDPGSVVVAPVRTRADVLGALTWVRSRGRPPFDGADLSLAEDVAGRGALALDRVRRLREAQEQNRLKDQFLAVLSHELRTPLNAIVGWAEILRGEPGPAMTARAVEVIARNAHLEAKLIADILEISRAVAGKTRLERQPVDLRAVAEAAVETVRPAATTKAVNVEVSGDVGGRTVAGDPARLQQVAWNLLTNAIAFTPAGGSARVVVRRVGDWGELAVADSGEGIHPDFLPHVFEPFRQEDSSPARSRRGLGLGLAIARELAHLHGGDIRAESEGPGKGARFTLRVPLGALEPTRTAPAAPMLAPIFREPVAGLSIVVVDDDRDTLEMVETYLGAEGVTVRVASSAEHAVELVRETRPDVLVTDIGMPGEDGYALIRQVRALPPDEGGLTPAIALTAYAREEDRLRALMAGFQAHVAKPVSLPELSALIGALGARDRSG
ncbi:MAG TPA: response regulator, partial [Vicinamibacteria bacterium]|nr:response regulator [Vicinamibacteria bacterium]